MQRTCRSWLTRAVEWMTRVPATLTEAQQVIQQATPATMVRGLKALALTCCPQPTGAWRNAGCCSTPNIASRRRSVRSIRSGLSRVTDEVNAF